MQKTNELYMAKFKTSTSAILIDSDSELYKVKNFIRSKYVDQMWYEKPKAKPATTKAPEQQQQQQQRQQQQPVQQQQQQQQQAVQQQTVSRNVD